MATTRRRQFTQQRQRSGTDWGRVNFAHTVVASGSKVLLATFVLSNPGIGETIRRTRGVFSVQSDQSATMEEQIGAIGMMVVNSAAVTAGVASLPGPITDGSDDGWFVWEAFAQISGATIGGIATGSVPLPRVFDSKAMRKVADGFEIAVIAQATGDGMEVAAGIALLGSRT